MENEKGILEVLVESLKKQDRMANAHDLMLKAQERMIVELKGVKDEVKGVAQEVKGLKEEMKETNHRLYVLETKSDKVEEQLVKLNLQTGENSRAIFKLADNVQQIADLHNRVTKLEKTVYK
jgi:hypothetical protein